MKDLLPLCKIYNTQFCISLHFTILTVQGPTQEWYHYSRHLRPIPALWLVGASFQPLDWSEHSVPPGKIYAGFSLVGGVILFSDWSQPYHFSTFVVLQGWKDYLFNIYGHPHSAGAVSRGGGTSPIPNELICKHLFLKTFLFNFFTR